MANSIQTRSEFLTMKIKEHRFTIQGLSKDIGINRKTIQRILKDENYMPHQKTLDVLLAALGIDGAQFNSLSKGSNKLKAYKDNVLFFEVFRGEELNEILKYTRFGLEYYFDYSPIIHGGAAFDAMLNLLEAINKMVELCKLKPKKQDSNEYKKCILNVSREIAELRKHDLFLFHKPYLIKKPFEIGYSFDSTKLYLDLFCCSDIPKEEIRKLKSNVNKYERRYIIKEKNDLRQYWEEVPELKEDLYYVNKPDDSWTSVMFENSNIKSSRVYGAKKELNKLTKKEQKRIKDDEFYGDKIDSDLYEQSGLKCFAKVWDRQDFIPTYWIWDALSFTNIYELINNNEKEGYGEQYWYETGQLIKAEVERGKNVMGLIIKAFRLKNDEKAISKADRSNLYFQDYTKLIDMMESGEL